MSAAVFRTKGQSYTCIRITDGQKQVHFIPMSSLQIEKLDTREFYTNWEEFPSYPVRRAAELYLGAGQYREIAPQAREHLERIVANPATEYDPAHIFPNPSKEPIMNAPAKQPATSKTGKASTAPAKTKVAGTTKPAATSKTKPANGMDTVVKQATAAAANKKVAPGKQAAPAKTAAPAKSAAKTAPGKQAAPAKAAPVARTAPNADQKLKVAEPDKPRRGVTQEFVNEAVKLKTFTRQQLHDAMVKKGHDSKAARIKIADCVYFKVFVEA